MYNEKDLPIILYLNIPVYSAKYGKGVVKYSDSRQIEVLFHNGERHAFVYPACFLMGILDFDFKYPDELYNYVTVVSIDDDNRSLEQFFSDETKRK